VLLSISLNRTLWQESDVHPDYFDQRGLALFHPSRIVCWMRGFINPSTRKMSACVLLATTLMIGATILAGALSGHPHYHFGEGRIMTLFSGFLLLAIAWLSFHIGRIRHVAPDRTFWKPQTAIWGIMALGFTYLALDEMTQIHESLDKGIHRLFRIEETNLTDRIDDAIVGMYGVIGIAGIAIYRKELVQHRQALPFLIVSFILFFMMVACDFLTSRPDVLEMFFEPGSGRRLRTWLSVAEESLKIYSGACFLLASCSALQRVKEERASSSSCKDVCFAAGSIVKAPEQQL
jgi:hypothetical protein